MNGIEHNLVADAPNLTIKPVPPVVAPPPPPKLGALAPVRVHWPEYLMEAGLLGAFMVSACVFGALYEFPRSPVRQTITSQLLRRLLMGISMGLTAIGIIYSPWGKQSGAHINPSVTFTFFRLGKIKSWDAIFYITAQFTGAVLGVFLVGRLLGKEISDPAVRYVVTVPGPHGPWVALLAEFIIAAGLMSAVLYFSNHHRLDRYTGLFAGLLVATYITLEAPFSGMTSPAASCVRLPSTWIRACYPTVFPMPGKRPNITPSTPRSGSSRLRAHSSPVRETSSLCVPNSTPCLRTA